MAAVLGIDLSETEHFGVCEFATQLSFHLVQVLYLLWAQCQTLFLVVSLEIVDMLDGGGLDVDREDILV